MVEITIEQIAHYSPARENLINIKLFTYQLININLKSQAEVIQYSSCRKQSTLYCAGRSYHQEAENLYAAQVSAQL